MHTPDLVDAHIKKIAEIFPNAITETMEGGTLRKVIDFDVLRQELSGEIVEGNQERYQFTWPDKKRSIVLANKPIAKTLRLDREKSVGRDGTPGSIDTDNIYIEGDNLDALKLLQETYLGKVKLIYIDPPYNTGNDFVYNDSFRQRVEEYAINSGQTDYEGNKLVQNSEGNGRFHTDWLNMMYPRLRLAKDLLSEEGVIFISIDDNEVENIKKCCNEIFGQTNFKCDIAWQKRYTRSNNTVDFTTVVEHILVYSKSSAFVVNLLPRTEEADNRYTNPDNDPRGAWKGASFLNPATPAQRPNLCYPIINPNTGEKTMPTTHAWRRSKEEFEKLQSEGKLYWGSDGKAQIPAIKMFLSEARGLTPINFWNYEYAGNTDEGTADLSALMEVKVFNNPKPVKLIKRVLEHGTSPGDLVLDFFSGSATTAQSVFQLNSEDDGNRKFILVQLPENTDEKSNAFKAGYRTICDIGEERIRRAGNKIKDDHPNADIDIGFRCFKVDSSNMKDVYYKPSDYDQNLIDRLSDNIKAERTPEDLLIQVMLDLGVLLSSKIEETEIAGKKVFSVADGYLIACFDRDITDDIVTEIAQRHPFYAVFRDSSMADDSVAANFEQIFETYSPSTVRKVL